MCTRVFASARACGCVRVHGCVLVRAGVRAYVCVRVSVYTCAHVLHILCDVSGSSEGLVTSRNTVLKLSLFRLMMSSQTHSSGVTLQTGWQPVGPCAGVAPGG